jgi:hypothetical protein
MTKPEWRRGEAEFVVQDTRVEMFEFLAESRKDIEEGRTEPAVEALERLARKHKLHRKDTLGG